MCVPVKRKLTARLSCHSFWQTFFMPGVNLANGSLFVVERGLAGAWSLVPVSS